MAKKAKKSKAKSRAKPKKKSVTLADIKKISGQKRALAESRTGESPKGGSRYERRLSVAGESRTGESPKGGSRYETRG